MDRVDNERQNGHAFLCSLESHPNDQKLLDFKGEFCLLYRTVLDPRLYTAVQQSLNVHSFQPKSYFALLGESNEGFKTFINKRKAGQKGRLG